MNKIRFSLFAVAAALILAASGLQAQTSIQRLTFSLLAEYQTNTFFTNSANPAGPLTNEESRIRTVLIATGNVVKALAVDLDGSSSTTWNGAELVREVNLTNGTEGIFLRKAGNQTNVSSFFGGSYSNNFTGELTNEFPALNTNFAIGFTNTITNVVTNGGFTNIFTNVFTNSFPSSFSNNFNLETPLVRGSRLMTGPTNTTTNFVRTAGLYFISLNTTNLKFNLVAVGDGAVANVAGRISGTRYELPVNFQHLGTAGSFYLNTTTNIFDTGTGAPVYMTGPIHGSFSTTTPTFSAIAGP